MILVFLKALETYEREVREERNHDEVGAYPVHSDDGDGVEAITQGGPQSQSVVPSHKGEEDGLVLLLARLEGADERDLSEVLDMPKARRIRGSWTADPAEYPSWPAPEGKDETQCAKVLKRKQIPSTLSAIDTLPMAN